VPLSAAGTTGKKVVKKDCFFVSRFLSNWSNGNEKRYFCPQAWQDYKLFKSSL
jgi:hypothetical protein